MKEGFTEGSFRNNLDDLDKNDHFGRIPCFWEKLEYSNGVCLINRVHINVSQLVYVIPIYSF